MYYKRKPPYGEEESWMDSLAVPTAGAVAACGLSYFLGRSEYSVVWLCLLIAFNVAKSYLWKKRETRLLSLRAARMREREVILAQLADLPAWVQFPDTERVEWMNKVIQQLWPYIGEYTKVFMVDTIIPQVKSQLPGVFKSFKFTKMDMGDIGCRVGGIKVYTHNVGRDRIIVDMDIAYAGDADFTISCCGFTGGMNEIQFSGKLRCVLKPLLPYPPMVGGISGTFLEMPKIDFNLTGMGEMVELPGLMNAIRAVVNSQVAAMCVVPNEIVVPLVPEVDVTQLFFPEPNGVVRITVIEARHLENRDISFIKKGNSDPYCEIQVGAQFMKTQTIDNNLNPVWNETFEAIVDKADGQTLRIECFDEDQGQDEELGRLSLSLSLIRERASLDKWYPLEGCKHGDLHIKATWLDLSCSASDVEREEWQAEWAQAEKAIHSALVMVFVDNASDLPYPKAKLEPSPFIEVSLGKQKQQTPVRVKTVNPLFQSRFHFFASAPAAQTLIFEAIDEGTRRSLGSVSLPLSNLLKMPRLELYQETLMLSLGVQQSPLVVTIRVRGLVHGVAKAVEPAELKQDLLAHYANGAYIERANGSRIEKTQEKNGMDELLVEERKGKGSAADTGSSISIHSSQGIKGTKLPSSYELQLSVAHDVDGGRLLLQVSRGRLGFPRPSSSSLYVAVALVDASSHEVCEKRKTSSVREAEPVFDNNFVFQVAKGDIANYEIEFRLKEEQKRAVISKKITLATLRFRLDSLPGCNLAKQWVQLQPLS